MTDFTRNRHVIQVYSTLVRSPDLKIVNQNNNLLTTIIINDPTTNYCRSVEDICIPMITRFDRLMFLCLRFGRGYHAIERRIRTPVDYRRHVWWSAFLDSTDEPVQYDRSVQKYHKEGSISGQPSLIRSVFHLVCVVVYGLRVAQRTIRPGDSDQCRQRTTRSGNTPRCL